MLSLLPAEHTCDLGPKRPQEQSSRQDTCFCCLGLADEVLHGVGYLQGAGHDAVLA